MTASPIVGRHPARIHERFGRAAVPIQLPLGSEKDFRGVIDLIRMKAYVYTFDGDGKGQETEIPEEYAEAAQKAHAELVQDPHGGCGCD